MQNDSKTVKETLSVKKNSLFLCQISTEIVSHFDNSSLIALSGLVVVSLLEEQPSKGKSHNYHIPLDFTHNGPWRISTAGDFQIPLTIRGLGVARLIWHRIFTLLPQEVRDQVIVTGRLSPLDSNRINGPRRDRLWMDVSGYAKGHSKAKFTPQIDTEYGYFEGYFHDPWDQSKSLLEWIIL